jgi:hypothetical protein
LGPVIIEVPLFFENQREAISGFANGGVPEGRGTISLDGFFAVSEGLAAPPKKPCVKKNNGPPKG